MIELKMSDLSYRTDSLSFTGTRYLTSVSKQKFRDSFLFLARNWGFHELRRFCFGAAKCVDTVAGEWIKELLPGPEFERWVIVPGDQSKVDWSFKNWATHVFYMPSKTDYKDRNQMLVNLSRWIAGFPNRDEMEDPRSGTWQCLRQARKERRKIFIQPLINVPPIWET